MKSESQSADFLVIGSGAAGLNFALNAAKHGSVLLITKEKLSDSATEKAQGGIAAATAPGDSIEKHIQDTLKAGHHKNKLSTVRHIISKGPQTIKYLQNLGVKFDKTLRREGGHSKRRIHHVGDHTGEAIEKALIRAVRKEKNIEIHEHTRAIKLLKSKGKITGATTAGEQVFYAKTTVLTTGGIGQKFPHTTNPPISTGDGIEMAKEAGAKLMDMEHVQFHPTVLSAPGKPTFMLTEALRGEGAKLINEKGERFVDELATRDIVCQAMEKQEQVFLDFTHKKPAWTQKNFPLVYKTLKKHSFDLTRDKIPIAPAAHFLCGGIATDLYGHTSLPGLLAFGETARTGLHGKNRLASNSLLEAIVTTIH